MANTNFIQWNPGQLNQETDAQYAADGQRNSGAVDDSPFPAKTANKAFYQLSTFVTAFAKMLANKGVSTADTDINVLSAVLATVRTAADQLPPIVSLGYSPTPVFDCSLGTTFRFNLDGNVSSSTLANIPGPGVVVTFFIVSSNPGNFSFAWPAQCQMNPPDVRTQSTGNLLTYQFISDGGNLFPLSTFLVYLQSEVVALQNQSVATAANVATLQGQIAATNNNLAATNVTVMNNNATLQGEINTKQNALGFVPVQQGGGAGQGANKIFIGWDGAGLRAQVDTTDQGEILFRSSIGTYKVQDVTGGRALNAAYQNNTGFSLKVWVNGNSVSGVGNGALLSGYVGPDSSAGILMACNGVTNSGGKCGVFMEVPAGWWYRSTMVANGGNPNMSILNWVEGSYN